MLSAAGGTWTVWLAEGLACYCEATESGEWQAIGAPNSGRIRDLARAQGKFIPLQTLVKGAFSSFAG